MDAYLPSDWILGGYQTGPEGNGLHFRAGALANIAKGTSDEVDYREYFLGANFLAPVWNEGLIPKPALASDFDIGFHRCESDAEIEGRGGKIRMKHLAFPKLVIPAFDLVSQRTLYINNLNIETGLGRNGDVLLLDAISSSAFSAVKFFGKYPAPQYQQFYQFPGQNVGEGLAGTRGWYSGAVFNDGRQGTQNSPLLGQCWIVWITDG